MLLWLEAFGNGIRIQKCLLLRHIHLMLTSPSPKACLREFVAVNVPVVIRTVRNGQLLLWQKGQAGKDTEIKDERQIGKF